MNEINDSCVSGLNDTTLSTASQVAECMICYEKPDDGDGRHIMLPCLHSFCLKCLLRVQELRKDGGAAAEESKEEEKQSETKIRCQYCRREFECRMDELIGYKGKWRQGKQGYGYGKYTDGKGLSIKGRWQEDRMGMLKEGKIKLAGGKVLQGLFKNGMISKGRVIREDGSREEGIFDEGQLKYGRVVFGEDRIAEGKWDDGQLHGFCRITLPSGLLFEGEMNNGEMTGIGKITNEETGFVFEGQIKDGLPHGIGQSNLADGRVYEGDFFDGRRHGWGVLTLDSGHVYQGTFHQGLLYGTGLYTSPEGKQLQAIFQQGKIFDVMNGKIVRKDRQNIILKTKHLK